MGNSLYVLAVMLIIIWAFGFLAFNFGGVIHLLVVIAIIMVIIRFIQGKKIA